MAHGNPKGRGARGSRRHDVDDFNVHAHVASIKFYVGILAILVMFTLLTVAVARFTSAR